MLSLKTELTIPTPKYSDDYTETRNPFHKIIMPKNCNSARTSREREIIAQKKEEDYRSALEKSILDDHDRTTRSASISSYRAKSTR